MWQGVGTAAMQGGGEATSSAMGMYAGYRIGAKSDKVAFERQKWMAGHAHQLEVDDLRKAGLNPILSAGGSGASFPTATSTTSSTAMSGADLGSRIGKSLTSLGLAEVKARIDNIKATTAKEKAAQREIDERTKLEYGTHKVVGNSQVKMKDGTVVDVPEVKRVPGRQEMERDLMGTEYEKAKRLWDVMKTSPRLLDAWIMIDAARDVSNSARSVTGLVTDFLPGKAGGKSK